MRLPRISLSGFLLSTGFFGAAVGAGAKAIALLTNIDESSVLAAQGVILAVAVGPLIGAGLGAPFGWCRCRVGAYVGFFSWVSLLIITTALLEFIQQLNNEYYGDRAWIHALVGLALSFVGLMIVLAVPVCLGLFWWLSRRSTRKLQSTSIGPRDSLTRDAEPR